MNLEVGKKYKTRNGSIVEIVAIRPELRGNQVAGIMDEEYHTWYINGSYMKGHTNNLDLVAEHKETQKREVWLNISEICIHAYFTKKQAEENQYPNLLACKKITIEYTEGEGL